MVEIFKKLKSARELKTRVVSFLGEETLIQLEKDGIVPHYLLTNPATKEYSIFFNPSELEEWFVSNCVQQRKSTFTQSHHFGLFDPNEDFCKLGDDVPDTLRQIRNIYTFPLGTTIMHSGIYFLCLDTTIQYIGKSTCLSSRVNAHIKEKVKPFNKVYFVPCPESQLDNLEGVLIKKYNPPLNGNLKGKLNEEDISILNEITQLNA